MADQRFDAALENLLAKYPQLYGMPEKALRREIRALGGAPPDPADYMLRMRFWVEYDTAMTEGRKMMFTRIYSGVVMESHLWELIKRPFFLAFMLCPITTYEQNLNEAVGFGITKLRDFLALDVICPVTGKINVGLINAQAKIVMMLDMRKHGAFTQRVENKNLNLHASAKDVAGEIANLSMEEVEKRMKKIEALERDSFLIEQKASRPTYTLAPDQTFDAERTE